jgi:hypothetical protein
MNSGEMVRTPLRQTRLRKQWHRGLTLLLALLIGGVLATSAVRTLRMWGLPKVAEPFDVAAFKAEVIPEAENGYSLYLDARRSLTERPKSIWTQNARLDPEWNGLLPEMKTWFDQNLPAIETWRRGTQRRFVQVVRSSNPSVEEQTYPGDTIMWSRLALLQASRLEADGNVDKAWRWHLARIRFALQNNRRGSLIERWSSSFAFSQIISRTQAWADQPGVTVAGLRDAISDLEAVDSLYPKRSDSLKAQYLWFVEMLDNAHIRLEQDEPNAANGPTRSFPVPIPLRPLFWNAELYLKAEPERSRRVLRLIFANSLPQADKPPRDRTKIVSTDPLVFEFEPGQTPPISAESLVAQIQSAPLIKAYRDMGKGRGFTVSTLDDWPTLFDTDRRAVANLIVTLASRMYEIETGTWPASPELLVGKAIAKLPDDYLAPDGGDVKIVPDPTSEKDALSADR